MKLCTGDRVDGSDLAVVRSWKDSRLWYIHIVGSVVRWVVDRCPHSSGFCDTDGGIFGKGIPFGDVSSRDEDGRKRKLGHGRERGRSVQWVSIEGAPLLCSPLAYKVHAFAAWPFCLPR